MLSSWNYKQFSIVGMESVDTQGAWEEERPKRCYWVYVSLSVCMSSLKMHIILYACILNLHKCIHSGFPFFFIKGNVFKIHQCCYNNNLNHSYELLSDISWCFMLCLYLLLPTHFPRNEHQNYFPPHLPICSKKEIQQ